MVCEVCKVTRLQCMKCATDLHLHIPCFCKVKCYKLGKVI